MKRVSPSLLGLAAALTLGGPVAARGPYSPNCPTQGDSVFLADAHQRE